MSGEQHPACDPACEPTINVRSQLCPAGRVYAVARVRDLSRSDKERLVAIKRRLGRRRRPRHVERALSEVVAIVVPGLEREVVAALDTDARWRVVELALRASTS